MIFQNDESVFETIELIEHMELRDKEIFDLIRVATENKRIEIALVLLQKDLLKPDDFLLTDSFSFLGKQEFNLLTLVRHYPILVQYLLEDDLQWVLEENNKNRRPLFYMLIDAGKNSILKISEAMSEIDYHFLTTPDVKGNTLLHFLALRQDELISMYEILHEILKNIPAKERAGFLGHKNEGDKSALDIAKEVGNRNAIILFSLFLSKALHQPMKQVLTQQQRFTLGALALDEQAEPMQQETQQQRKQRIARQKEQQQRKALQEQMRRARQEEQRRRKALQEQMRIAKQEQQRIAKQEQRRKEILYVKKRLNKLIKKNDPQGLGRRNITEAIWEEIFEDVARIDRLEGGSEDWPGRDKYTKYDV
jgi:hypothetical protein